MKIGDSVAASAPDRQPASPRWVGAAPCQACVLSRNRPATPSAMKRACQVHTTGFDLPDRRMISVVPQPSAVARMILARPDMFLGRAAIRDDRFKPTAILSCDLDDNLCSHAESLNCFGRFGNRPNGSDHQQRQRSKATVFETGSFRGPSEPCNGWLLSMRSCLRLIQLGGS